MPLWKFTLVDDHSRYLFVRLIACPHANSIHVIEFLLEAFRHMGIPRMLYTDNDSVIVSKRMQRAASILDRAFAESGGFKLEQHRAGNPQATGKVERAHQIVEKYEKVFGLSDEPPTLADINRFCEGLCLRKNSLPHRENRRGAGPAVPQHHGCHARAA